MFVPPFWPILPWGAPRSRKSWPAWSCFFAPTQLRLPPDKCSWWTVDIPLTERAHAYLTMKTNYKLTLSAAMTITSLAAADPTAPVVAPDEALGRLKAGNERFVSNKDSTSQTVEPRPSATAGGQPPFAIVGGCA